MRKLALLFSIALAAAAQPVIAPTGAPVGPTRGQDVGDYNVENSFETGYRFHSVGGNEGKYRSDVNFGNGLRLLGATVSVHSREGHGRYFDELLLSTQGLGNDPYEFATLRIAKNRIYRYDLQWRLNDYYNPALPLSAGFHRMNTVRTLQDHSLVLLPESAVRIFAGYSRVNQNGPALSTVVWPDIQSDVFPLFADIRRLQDEFRLGAEVRAYGARLTILRTWEEFREDTRRTSGANPGFTPDDPTSLNLFRRDEPYHGNTDSWRANLAWDPSNNLNVNGRYTWVRARRNFVFDEAALGTARFLGSTNNQILVFGDGQRPVSSASLTVTVFPRSRVNIVNHTAFHNTRMEGNGAYRELDNATLGLALANFEFLGIRTISNATDVNVTMSKVIGVFAGYQYSSRQIRSIEQTTFENTPDRITAEQTNTLNVGRLGVRLRPVKPLSFLLAAEVGRADRPVYPVSERNYHALDWRAQFKLRTLFLSAAVRTNYNVNSASLSSHSSRSRNYSADASWTFRPWLGVDANWSKLHLDTLSGIAYFYNRVLIGDDRSSYISNIHSGSLALRVGLRSRADFYAGYTRVQDTGNGSRPTGAAPATPGAIATNIVPGSLAFQVYPLSFQSPYARLSIRLNQRLRWNVGYQYYGYSEELLPVQNYRAHTGFTSISWAF